MQIKNANFPFRQESATDAFVLLWGATGCFAFLATEQRSDGLWHDCGWAVFRSKSITQMKHGHPNDEAFAGHILYHHGLDQFDIAEVENSPWMDEIKKVNAAQFPSSANNNWRCRHHIFPLKEVTLEVLWRDFDYDLQKGSFEEVRQSMIDWMHHNR